MTPKQKKRLHHILLDAKSEIKDGKLRLHDEGYAMGICEYVHYHKLGAHELHDHCYEMYLKSHLFRGGFVALVCDFSHPDRLALLDYLIEQTKD